MSIFKDFLFIVFGAVLAYTFDLIKQYSDRSKEKKEELTKICNELITICSKMEYLTTLWFDKFIEYHYYLQFFQLSKDPGISTLMTLSKSDNETLKDKIADSMIHAEYCFDEIRRIAKIDFGTDEKFIIEYKLMYKDDLFTNIKLDKLKELYKESTREIEIILDSKYRPVFKRVKLKVKELRDK